MKNLFAKVFAICCFLLCCTAPVTANAGLLVKPDMYAVSVGTAGGDYKEHTTVFMGKAMTLNTDGFGMYTSVMHSNYRADLFGIKEDATNIRVGMTTMLSKHTYLYWGGGLGKLDYTLPMVKGTEYGLGTNFGAGYILPKGFTVDVGYDWQDYNFFRVSGMTATLGYSF